jgi:catechol 2,3-dioxygenase-like lactoylglutathione lyase family enzyme
MPSRQYAQSLTGLTVNLLVPDIPSALRFQEEVLGAEVVYQDPDFAVVRSSGSEWMLHADHTYDKHPMGRDLSAGPRGKGLELRLHGCDPDRAEASARRLGYAVIDPATDKPHGLREAYLQDGDGYIWVVDIHVKSDG